MMVNSRNKVSIWDTYVTKKDGTVMHFDIVVPKSIIAAGVIYEFGKAYLKTKQQEGQPLSSEECRFCHVESLRPEWEKEIESKGYFVIEMEGCN